MKLHIYDHCPFCVRARMAFGLKALPVTLTVVPNDDEQTPIRMIGKKMLPILEDGDGFMGESLDIVRKIDGLGGPRRFDGPPNPALLAWIEQWNPVVNDLVIPRTPDPVYTEFATASARAYFTAKKQASFGDFAVLKGRSGALKADLAQALAALVAILPDPDQPGIDDILLFPILRSLTVMADLRLPAPVAAYMERMAARSAVPLVSTLRATASPGA